MAPRGVGGSGKVKSNFTIHPLNPCDIPRGDDHSILCQSGDTLPVPALYPFRSHMGPRAWGTTGGERESTLIAATAVQSVCVSMYSPGRGNTHKGTHHGRRCRMLA